MKNLQEIVAALKARGYEAQFCATADEAAAEVVKRAQGVANVGWGGSETVKALGLREKMAALGLEIRDHRTDCDLFLLSANALLEDGRIVNVDGTGNRIAASIFGPKHVIYLIGRNKVVAGGVDDAIRRIKEQACPPNARRLGRKTPCALTGHCADCHSPDRMCKVTVVFDAPPTHTPTTVLLIDAALGF